MIVVDTNVTVQLVIESTHSAAARRLLEIDPVWIVPPVWPHEFLNVLATYGKAGGMPVGRCLALWREALAFFANRIQPIDTAKALHLAVKHALSAYDAQFIQLAQTERVPFISEDRRLREKFSGLAFSISNYIGDLPPD